MAEDKIDSSRSSFVRGLLVGRFQPFHLGHLTAVRSALKNVSELIIGIAAIDRNLTYENPFSCRERLEMIWGSIVAEDRKHCLILPIPDHVNNRLWLDYLLQYAPYFDVSFTNNPQQTLIMRTAGIPVESVCYKRRSEFQGSIIRSLLANGDHNWKELVPDGTCAVLNEIEAEQRLTYLKTIDNLE